MMILKLIMIIFKNLIKLFRFIRHILLKIISFSLSLPMLRIGQHLIREWTIRDIIFASLRANFIRNGKL
jgi:hypothetical protein